MSRRRGRPVGPKRRIAVTRADDERDLAMLRLYAEGMTESAIAARYGVTKGMVVGLRNRVRKADMAESGEAEAVVWHGYVRGAAR